MNRLNTLLLLLFIMGCNPNQVNNDIVDVIKIEDVITVNEPQFIDDPYDIDIKIKKVEKNDYTLEISMVLHNGSYFVSPNSKGDFSGIFSVSIKDNDKLKLDSKFIETPLSVEEYDSHPFVGGYINWVKVNTTYKKQLQLISQEDFEVSGFIRFVIEPRCTREQIGFTISQHSGKINVKSFKINNGCPTTPFDNEF